MARHEPLPGSDVDTGIVWADSGGADPGEHIRQRATHVLDEMEKCGLRRCPKGANADNPLFSRSRTAWAAAARTWITEPTREGALLLSSIAADSRPITEVTIGRAVTDAIRETARGEEFLAALLHFALSARPPVGFIRDFVVEHSGEHRGDLEPQAGRAAPDLGSGPVAGHRQGEVRGSTPERLSRAAAAGLLTADEAETLAGAFKDVYELLLRQEVAAIRDRSGRLSNWIAPRDLDPLTRRHLRDSFRAISSVQAQVENGWKHRMTPGMTWAASRAAAAGRGLPADWREARYCAVDVETTGLDLRRDSIVSVGSGSHQPRPDRRPRHLLQPGPARLPGLRGRHARALPAPG